ncbi:MAG: sigma-70 family RNA polymerase sigma factor [Planctomycetes bacterium]|nr:sigma-70 family RNA polymerase sigma factor [Planctomycetota bacterium]
MRDPDTNLHDGSSDFPETTWGLVARLRKPKDLEVLCRRYWRPIYLYVRAAWSKSNEDAKDLSQAFFLWLIEDDVLRKYEPQRGGFRHYLKGLLRNFVGHRERALGALKRGGGAKILPICEDAVAEALVDGETPEQALDRAWMTEVVKQATERVRARLADGDRAILWRVFEEYDIAGRDATYTDVAARLGISESDVRNHLFAVREKIREEIRLELCDTVSDPRELEDEWRALLGA